jgi:hypothetical protein
VAAQILDRNGIPLDKAIFSEKAKLAHPSVQNEANHYHQHMLAQHSLSLTLQEIVSNLCADMPTNIWLATTTSQSNTSSLLPTMEKSLTFLS